MVALPVKEMNFISRCLRIQDSAITTMIRRPIAFEDVAAQLIFVLFYRGLLFFGNEENNLVIVSGSENSLSKSVI